MADDIVQSLLEGQKDSVTQSGIQRQFRQGFDDLLTAGDTGEIQESLREELMVCDQRTDRIVTRIDCPDNFIEPGNQRTSRVGKLI